MSKLSIAAAGAVAGVLGTSGWSFGQLVVGVNGSNAMGANPPLYYITTLDPNTAVAKPLYAAGANRGVLGVVADPDNGVLYSTTGTRLNTWIYGTQPTPPTLTSALVRTNTNAMAGVSATGFDDFAWAQGHLYGSTVTVTAGLTAPKGIYQIPTTADVNGRSVATLQWADTANVYKFEGLTYSPIDGMFYGLNSLVSGGQPLGLYAIDGMRNGTATPQFITAMPDGYARMDGLAFDFTNSTPGHSRFYMSQDDPANSQVVIAGLTVSTSGGITTATYDAINQWIGLPYVDLTQRSTGLAWAPGANTPEASSLGLLPGLLLLARRRR